MTFQHELSAIAAKNGARLRAKRQKMCAHIILWIFFAMILIASAGAIRL